MSIARIYQATPIHLNQHLELDEAQSHHLIRVLRVQSGERITVFNGTGGDFTAQITSLTKNKVVVKVVQFNDRKVESPIDITLAQGIARGEKMDFIIQKAVELGVKNVIPIISERTNVRLTDDRMQKKINHWRSVSVSASEQSGRTLIANIADPVNFRDWVNQVSVDHKFVLTPHHAKKFNKDDLLTGSFVLLIGPEGGLSQAEIDLAINHHFLPINLGPRILRTETAGLAAITMMQAFYGDLV